MLRETIIKEIQSRCGSSRSVLNLGHSLLHTRYVPITTFADKTRILSSLVPSEKTETSAISKRSYSSSMINLSTDYKSMYLTNSNIITKKKKKKDLSDSGVVKNLSSLSWDSIEEEEEDDFDYVESTSNASIPSSTVTPPTTTTTEYENVFPSIVIDKNGIEPQGTFAEAQTEFLDPDMDTVQTLSDKLTKANMGVVAHYYMDVELQSVLQKVSTLQQQEQQEQQKQYNKEKYVPNVTIADSLKMGEDAVQMVKHNGVKSIVCLGVDFMAESVSAILQRNGYGHVPVYRSTTKSIGCSLAASAETDMYQAWLRKAAQDVNPALHVIYINTSLETKAISSSIIPTITCTSSNVIKTILQSSAQIPNLQIYFGPDTYMGTNITDYFDMIIKHPAWTDEKIKSTLHPHHTNDTLKSIRDNIHVYANGNCVVHHMFGNDVVECVEEYYNDDNTYITAHLEVPSEMFHIAMKKSLYDNGVVGSTSDILNFITKKVKEHSTITNNNDNTIKKLRFVLGTEAGMVTSIISNVQDILQKYNNNIQAEIIFPVASEAFTINNSNKNNDLAIVPGVKSSEGCSTAGGCATCPFMKMNDLNALEDIIDMELVSNNDHLLMKHLPPKNKLFTDKYDKRKLALFGNDDDVDVMDYAVEPIMHMRKYMNDGAIGDELVDRIYANGSIISG